MQNVPPLTKGCVKQIYLNQQVDYPVVQVIDVKKIQSNAAQTSSQPERYRLVISDGVHYQQAMLATQLNDMIRNNIIDSRCVIKLNEYVCNTIHNRRIVIILNLEIVAPSLSGNIGSPQNIEQVLGSNVQSANAPTGSTLPPQPNRNQLAPTSSAPTSHAPPNRNQAPKSTSQPHSMRPSPIPSNSGNNSSSGDLSGFPVYPIKNLNPYQNRWTIKARVTSKMKLEPGLMPKVLESFLTLI